MPVILWEVAPAVRGPRPTAIFLYAVLTTERREKFTNHKFGVGQHVTFGLDNRRIPIQYRSWSAKGFGEAIELLVARWMKLLDTGIRLVVLTHYASWPT